MAVARTSLWNLDVTTYQRHALHQGQRAWPESNCYVDLVIEFLHAAKLEPTACLGVTLASDFEGDQFTFFKPSFGDIEALYGVEILELNLWRNLADQVALQLERGKLVLVEMDAFFLPDTQGTDYRTQHTKTTVGIETLDRAERRMGYFHNAGYYEVSGDDFDGLFAAAAPPHLPPYVEMVRFDRMLRRTPAELVEVSVELARQHLRKRPPQNPIAPYRKQLASDLTWLFEQGLATYHQYAFSMLRQLGAAFEFAALYLRWLEQHGHAGLDDAALAFETISSTAKTLILKLARAVNSKKLPDLDAMLETMQQSWDRGMETVVVRLRP
jgi:hypothetical protein